MATEQVTPNTLADQIAAVSTAIAGHAPADVLAVHGQEIDALVRSSIAASGLHEAAQAPILPCRISMASL